MNITNFKFENYMLCVKRRSVAKLIAKIVACFLLLKFQVFSVNLHFFLCRTWQVMFSWRFVYGNGGCPGKWAGEMQEWSKNNVRFYRVRKFQKRNVRKTFFINCVVWEIHTLSESNLAAKNKKNKLILK